VEALAGTKVLWMIGQPLNEPIAAYGPFVMNTENEIRQAFDDYQQGRLGTVPVGGIRPYRG
jgi:redox-sensitive bicupin YhaK (pirin superfamily)